jgi:type II secretory pathway pseudopilin PulG
MQDVSVPVWAVAVAVAGLLLAVALLTFVVIRGRRRVARQLDAARAEAEALRVQVEEIQRRLEERQLPGEQREYVITGLDTSSLVPRDDYSTTGHVPTVPAPLFADMVLRESVVQAAALAAGLRRALSPESRNRIWFEMRREVKRARKQRRADLREARREWEARQRSRVDLDDGAEGSAA